MDGKGLISLIVVIVVGGAVNKYLIRTFIPPTSLLPR